jgi:hypothetical protein
VRWGREGEREGEREGRREGEREGETGVGGERKRKGMRMNIHEYTPDMHLLVSSRK